jgi:hypothetical protein
MTWLDLDENTIVNVDRIIAVEKSDEFNSIIYVDFGGRSKSFNRNIQFDVLKKILYKRSSSSIEKNLEQLAKYQTSFAG